MSPFVQTLLVTCGCLTVLMLMLWVISVIRRDASVVDPFWGTGFVCVAWLACGWNPVSYTHLTLPTIA